MGASLTVTGLKPDFSVNFYLHALIPSEVTRVFLNSEGNQVNRRRTPRTNCYYYWGALCLQTPNITLTKFRPN